MPLPNRVRRSSLYEDFTIGEPDEDFLRLAAGERRYDDFILGETDDSELLFGQASYSDFRSIHELIAEELGGDLQENPNALISNVEPLREKPVVQAPILDHHELGEDIQFTHAAMEVLRRIQPEVAKLSQVQHFQSKDREIILETMHEYQASLREHLSKLQDLVAGYIRQGEFTRVAAVDSVKRKLDELFLQLRALENRITNKGCEVVSGSYVDGTSADQLYQEASEDSSTLAKKNQQKTAARRKLGFSFHIPRQAKLGFALFTIVVLWPLCYYLSANWGVQPVKSVDVTTYQKVLPLVSASGSKQAVNGIVDDSWKRLDKAKKEESIRQLAAMLKVEGYQSIFLMYKGHGIAAIYNGEQDKIVVQ